MEKNNIIEVKITNLKTYFLKTGTLLFRAKFKEYNMKNKIIWLVKQLFPFQYFSEYTENGVKKLTIFRMFFGRTFAVKTWDLL